MPGCFGARAAWLAFACLSMLSPAAVRAQSVSSATVTGTVYDPSGAVVPSASVSIANRETNQVREATSDGRGRYRLLYVPVGDYVLSVSAQGFTTSTVRLTLAIGQAIDVPVKLLSASATEAVNVTSSAPLIEAARTHAAETIRPHEIDTLPLNGRNYLDLALLAPNVSRTNTRSGERFAETSAVPGTGISVAGQRNLGNSFLVDGLSANDDAADLAGTYYGEEVIREFQVVTSGGGAQFGRASAGTINVVTQSGGNQARGRVYAFFRNDRLDARNALATGKDPLTQHQFGATAGGPLARDRTFWFANVERTMQDKTGFVTIAAGDVQAIDAALDAFGFTGARAARGPFPTGYHTTNAFGRLDHSATAAARLEARYNVYDVSSPNARNAGGLNDVSRGTRLDDTDQNAAVGLLSSLSASAVHELRAQYTRSRLAAAVNDPVGPAISISGVANLGTSTGNPTARDLDVLQVADTLAVQRGAHLVKAGADVLFNRVTILFPGALQGTYSFSSIANLQRGAYQQFQQAFGIPGLSQSNPNLGLFVQDEWHPRGGLTVDAGIRYDLQWLPDPIRLDRNNVSPRLGVAWAPGGSTVVRASGGVYYDRIPLRASSNALQRDGVNYKVAVLSAGQAGAPVFPTRLAAFPPAVVSAITSMDPEIQNGRSEQFTLQLERGLGRVVSATVGYSYLRGHGIIMSRNINVPTLTAAQAAALGVPNLGRPNPAFGNISQYQSIGDSWFKGLTASVATRGGTWGSARVSYTLSSSEDTSGNTFFSTPQDNTDIAAERGPSDNDQRQRVAISGTLGGTARRPAWLGGMQIGAVFAYATGVPFNVTTGADRNNDTTINDRPAGVGRNSERQASTTSLDLRVSRSFPVGGRHRIEAMAEAFNVTNHVNVIAVNGNFGQGATPSPAFARPTVAGDPRQIQFGVRWTF